MTRWLLWPGGFLLGAVLALALEGSMGHLRMLAGDRLPGWTDAIAPDARLARGSAEFASHGPVGEPLHLAWVFGGIGAEGPHWRLRLAGPGVRGAADLRPRLRKLRLDGVSGEIEAAALSGLPLRPGGLIVIEAAEADIGVASGAPELVAASAIWRGAMLEDVPLGTGRIRLAAEDGRWQAPFTLEGGAFPVEGRIEGGFDGGDLRLRADITDTPGIPAGWRRALDSLGERNGPGWRLESALARPGLQAAPGQPPAAR